MLRRLACTVACLVVVAPATLLGQDKPASWSGSLTGMLYLVPDEVSYLLWIAAADRGRLHVEARYNYENLKTASALVGANFGFGSTVEVTLTPMAGAAFGRTDGLLVGLEGSVAWGPLELYSEAEHLFDLNDSADNYLYVWTELSGAPTSWLTLGIAGQRTRIVRQEVEVQRAVFVRLTRGRVGISGYLFNLDEDPYYVLGVEVAF